MLMLDFLLREICRGGLAFDPELMIPCTHFHIPSTVAGGDT
jgi:hypothetical protein